MAHRNKLTAWLPWYLTLPLLLALMELAASKLYPFSSPYFPLLFQKQPFLLSLTASLSLARVLLAYTLFSLTFELIAVPWIPSVRLRILIFMVGYTALTSAALYRFPGLAEVFPYISKTKGALFVLGVLAFLFLYAQREPKRNRRLFLPTLSLIFLTLWMSRSSPWTHSFHPLSQDKTDRPSFLVLSFDAVPGDLFYLSDENRSVAPLWHSHWQQHGISFRNAYSVTNSTYTSWFSILTGKLPMESGVLSLYPAERTGSLPYEDWIPKKLEDQGYETVFMTDCANTSSMKTAFGFRRLFQPDQGAFKSTQALITSAHPGLYAFSRFTPLAELFPELTSFSSHQYRPEIFFEKVKYIHRELETGNAPYFLVVHSCITHRDLAHHLPEKGSPLRRDLPQFHSFVSKPLEDLLVSIRMADRFTHDLFSSLPTLEKKTWKILLSDHGVRMEPEGNQLSLFSHGIGNAVSRYQYNIPFAILPPKQISLRNDPRDLVTIQDLGRFLLTLSSTEKTEHTFPIRKQLVLTSAVPSETPENWGKTLLPLIRNGTLDREGTFRFSAEDDAHMQNERSRAILSLPYRAVWSPTLHWEIFDEIQDPFNIHPMDPDVLSEKPRFFSSIAKAAK